MMPEREAGWRDAMRGMLVEKRSCHVAPDAKNGIMLTGSCETIRFRGPTGVVLAARAELFGLL
jgi:hypothetical protein